MISDWEYHGPDVGGDEIGEDRCTQRWGRRRRSAEVADVKRCCEEIRAELEAGRARPERLLKRLDELSAMPVARALATRHWLRAMLQAIELLMRHEGMLAEKHEVDVSGSISVVLKQALDRVQRMHLGSPSPGTN
jgi:hypothetical protein